MSINFYPSYEKIQLIQPTSTKKYPLQPTSTHFNQSQPTSPIFQPIFLDEKNRPLGPNCLGLK